ncbi:MAG: FtsX-like permease family protein [Tannerellaceae bacterium]|nr:FtsX-like permease family protein [Tannerellaceae bacterium]
MRNVFNLKSFFIFLRKNKLYTFIEILGLSLSLMFVILISVYTGQELCTDKFHQNGDRIYVLGNEEELTSAYGIGERLMNRYPEIEKVISISSGKAWGEEERRVVYYNDEAIRASIQYTYEDFFDFFSFEIIEGNNMQILSDLNSAVISETFAKAHFRDKNPIGQIIRLNGSVFITVTGVMKDISNSVIPYCDILARMEKLTEIYPEMSKNNYSNALNSIIFLLAKPETDLSNRSEEITTYLKSFYWLYEKGLVEKTILIPIKKVYFSNIGESSFLKHGDWKFVMILISVSILILLFSIINYINLTLAQTGLRAKEISIRRLLGNSKQELFLKLMIECIFLCFLSFLIGLVLAAIFAPYASKILETKINLIAAFTPINILTVILIIILLGGISGLLPAIQITKNKAIDVVKGTFRLQTKKVFSKYFITFQNIITIGMVVASLVMLLQINYMIKAPLGYQKDNIIDIQVGEIKNRSLVQTFIDELGQLPYVSQIGLTRSTPFEGGMNYTMQVEDKLISFQGFEFDEEAFNILGLEKVSDNSLSTEDGYFLNEYAFQLMNFDKDAKTFPFFGNPRPIAGMVKDFQLGNIMHSKSAAFIQIKRSENVQLENLLVQVQGNPLNAYKEIQNVYERIIRLDFPGKFVDQQVEESFAAQRKTSKIIILFSLIAIIISLLGLLAMSTYFIQQRAREIAIRKVFGSENIQIFKKLTSSFLMYVVIAFVIATPIIWYIMRQWLSDYSYRIKLSPLIFIAGGLFCFITSFITISWQSYKASNKNPIENTKIE